MAVARSLRRRASAVRHYLATAGPLARLIWRAGPHLMVSSAGLAVVGGVLPAADIVIVSALLQTLVNAGHPAGAGGSHAASHFVLLVVLLALVGLVSQVSQRLGALTAQLQGARIANRVQSLIADKAASVDLASFEDRAFQDDMRTVTNEARYRPSLMIQQLLTSVTTVATLVSLSVILIVWHAWVVATLLAASAATLWVSAHFGSAQVEMVVDRAETERSKFYLYSVVTTDQAAKEVRLFGLRDLLVGRFGRLVEILYQQDRRLALRQLGYSMPAGLVLAGTQAALIVFAAFEALHGHITIGRFNQYMLAIVQLGGQLPMLAVTLGSLHQDNLFAARLFAFLATEPKVEAPRPRRTGWSGGPAAAPVTPAAPRIVFDHVCFTYPGTNREVLTDVSFEARAGQSIALVGSNGSGKSTIVKLLAGLYEPTSGSVSLNGTDVRALDRAALRAELSVVFQDFVVYHLPARENVGLGQVSFLDDQDRIAAAARLSGLDRVIAALPAGYDTVLGRFWNQGHELSGGQRQLVALARALLRSAPVLALDEPSAALDARNEADFFRRLLDDPDSDRSRCVIFIAHRLSIARRADHILVLHQGRLVEQGSHQALMDVAGSYADMFWLQGAAYRDAGARPGTTTAGGASR
jgi:ATP-binding cassette subfamily B protein